MSQSNYNNNNDNNEFIIDLSSLNRKTFPELKKIINFGDQLNLNQQTDEQLKLILKSIGATIKGTLKKSEIFEEIISIIKLKHQHNQQQQLQQNLNQINTTTISNVTTTTTSTSNELLFWKVFRNLVLYRKIISFTENEFLPVYDSIISLKEMIKHKQFNLLRDKVIRHQFLAFNSFNNNVKSNSMVKLLKIYKSDNQENRLFYKQLFNHYCHHSILYSQIMVFKNQDDNNNSKPELHYIDNIREEFVMKIIQENSLPAIQILVKDYQFKPTNSNLKYSIILGRLKFIKLFLQPQFNLLQQQPISDTLGKNRVLSIKGLNYLFNEKLIDNSTLSYHLQRYYKIRPITEYTNLKTFLIIGKLILNVKNNENEDTLKLLKEVESLLINLTNEELKSILIDPSNHIDSKKSVLIKLIDLISLFTNTYKNGFIHHYFNIDVNCKPQHYWYSLYYVSVFQFINFQEFKSYQKDYNFLKFYLKGQFSKKRINNNQEIGLLFTHYHGNDKKEKSYQFINQMISLIKSGGESGSHLDATLLFYVIIDYNDLELIKHVSNELKDKILHDNQIDKITYNPINLIKISIISRYIKSIQVLEWLFDNHYLHFKPISIWYFNNVELLQHYHQLYCTKFNLNSTTGIIIPKMDVNQPCNIQVIKYIINCPLKFPILNINDHSILSIIEDRLSVNTNDKIELFKLIYLNYPNSNQIIEYINNSKPFYKNSKLSNIKLKFLSWLYANNFQNEFENLKDSIKNKLLK